MEKIFMKLFMGKERFIAAFIDIILCVLILFFAEMIFRIIGPLIGKPSVSNQALKFFKDNAFILIGLYPLINFLATSLRISLGRSPKLGVLSLAISSVLYCGYISLWMEYNGYSLKIFFGIVFLFIWLGLWLWRSYIVNKILLQNYEKAKFYFRDAVQDWLPPILMRIFPQIKSYFMMSPSLYWFVAFILLMLSCACALMLGMDIYAERTAGIAYIVLAVFVVIEIIQLIRNDTDNQEGKD